MTDKIPPTRSLWALVFVGGAFISMGTVWLVAVALLISVPLGIAAAIYLSEYAGENCNG